MLNVGEINLIGEFVEQAVGAGLARNIQACGNAVMIIEILKREIGPAQAAERAKAQAEAYAKAQAEAYAKVEEQVKKHLAAANAPDASV